MALFSEYFEAVLQVKTGDIPEDICSQEMFENPKSFHLLWKSAKKIGLPKIRTALETKRFGILIV